MELHNLKHDKYIQQIQNFINLSSIFVTKFGRLNNNLTSNADIQIIFRFSVREQSQIDDDRTHFY